LVNNLIQVRVRTPKSNAEAQRYTLANCAVEAKIMRESAAVAASNKKNEAIDDPIVEEEISRQTVASATIHQNDESRSCDESDVEVAVVSNRFSTLL